MNNKRQKQFWMVSRNWKCFFVKGYFQTDFFYIEEIDILLGMGKEGFEMVFKQDCNQTI